MSEFLVSEEQYVDLLHVFIQRYAAPMVGASQKEPDTISEREAGIVD